jgi:hypothetical protein
VRPVHICACIEPTTTAPIRIARSIYRYRRAGACRGFQGA